MFAQQVQALSQFPMFFTAPTPPPMPMEDPAMMGLEGEGDPAMMQDPAMSEQMPPDPGLGMQAPPEMGMPEEMQPPPMPF
jgi:hypothetical protein